MASFAAAGARHASAEPALRACTGRRQASRGDTGQLGDAALRRRIRARLDARIPPRRRFGSGSITSRSSSTRTRWLCTRRYVDHLGRCTRSCGATTSSSRATSSTSPATFSILRLDFNILLYTSSATLSATAAGYVGYVFGKAFALRAGFFSLPSVRSLTGTYPFFHSDDRSMATNYMRPGFTQGVWANGEPFPGFNYIAMIGNSLNTLDIAATQDRPQLRLFGHRSGTTGTTSAKRGTTTSTTTSRPCAWAPRLLRARRSPLGPLDGQPGEQRDVHLGRHSSLRDRIAGAGRHRASSRTSTSGRSTRA